MDKSERVRQTGGVWKDLEKEQNLFVIVIIIIIVIVIIFVAGFIRVILVFVDIVVVEIVFVLSDSSVGIAAEGGGLLAGV